MFLRQSNEHIFDIYTKLRQYSTGVGLYRGFFETNWGRMELHWNDRQRIDNNFNRLILLMVTIEIKCGKMTLDKLVIDSNEHIFDIYTKDYRSRIINIIAQQFDNVVSNKWIWIMNKCRTCKNY